MRKLIIPAALTVLAIACGGGTEAETVLHMRGFDMDSGQYRAHIRGTFAANAIGAGTLCRDIAPMNETEAQAYFAAASGAAIVPASATPKPGQTPDTESVSLAFSIIKDECGRL